MTGAAAGNIAYLQDRWRTGTSSATKQSMQTIRRPNIETAQSIVIVEPGWERLVWSRLQLLKNMRHGWDGTDARQLDEFTSEFGMKLLQALLPPNAPAPQLTLLRYGGLQFEWFTQRCEFEIEVIGPYRAKAWLNDIENDEETEVVFDYNVTQLSQLIDKMLRLNLAIADAAAAA
jgi:hypothetical protein